MFSQDLTQIQASLNQLGNQSQQLANQLAQQTNAQQQQPTITDNTALYIMMGIGLFLIFKDKKWSTEDKKRKRRR
jgi:hypothetical protein